MKTDFSTASENMKAATLAGEGKTEAPLRQAVADYANQVSPAHTPENGRIPGSLLPYLNKVGLYAYKIMDKDVEQLKELAYTEDEIFEITLAAAFGAGLARLESGLALLAE